MRYDYVDSEGNVTEYEFPMGKAPKEVDGLIRSVGMPAIVFKGTGWARVQYEHSAKDYARVKKIDWDDMAKTNNCM